MRSLADSWPNTYLSRLGVYLIFVVGASSIVGPRFVTYYGNSADAGLLAAAYLTLFGFAPALLIVAAAKLSARGVASVAVLATAGALGLWWLAASADSSTASLAFLAGWYVGIPVATVILATVEFRGRGTRPE